MRGKGAIAAGIGLALLVAGCTDSAYLRSGVGTDLVSADLAAASALQEVYVGEICRQAGLRVVARGDVLLCEEVGMRPSEWATFVQAGMNDIDRRCDAYLAWIDNKRRWQEPILKQINSTAAVTAAIMGLTGVGAVPIAIVGASFGFAQETFVNISARLITEVNHSVVQSVVLGNQNQFRASIAGTPVDSRPAAMYLLRNYLRICMPFSIEMSINNTMTVFHRGGGAALDRNDAILLQPSRVAKVTAAAGRAPIAPTDVIRRPERPTLPTLEDYKLIVANYDPKVHTISRVESALVKLCIPSNELRAIGETAKLKIQIYQQAVGNAMNAMLTMRDIARLNNSQDCTSTKLNYFEANLMPDGVNGADVVKLMNLVLANGRKLGTGASVADVRLRIPEVRASLGAKLTLQSPLLSDQFTSDLSKELVRLSLQ